MPLKGYWLPYFTSICLCGFVSIDIKNDADAVSSLWYNGTKESKIEISRCGNHYCGKLAWLREPTKDGKPETDKNNPNAQLRGRPVPGIAVMRNFKYNDNNVWVDGEIYDRQSGKAYSSKMTLY